MNANRCMLRCCALGLMLGLSVLLVGCATQPSSKSRPSYQPSDIEGTWSWTQDPWYGEFVLKKDGDSYAGTLNDVFEGTDGDKIKDVTVSGNRIKFTRDGRYGVQHWEGTLKKEHGVLKIIDGRWTKESGFEGSFSAEKNPPYSKIGNPVNLGPNVNSDSYEGSPDISADGMTLYFDALGRPGGLGGWDIWMSEAKAPHRAFARAVPLATPVNSQFDDCGPCISDDGLTLYFASNRPGGSGDCDIWVATRKTPRDAWGEPVNLGPTVNSRYYDNHPSISTDGLTLYFDSRRPGVSLWPGYNDIYMSRRPTANDAWSKPELLAINTEGLEYSPDVTSDGLTLYYDSPLAGRDIWVTRRASPTEAWKKGVPLGSPFNTPGIDTDPSISADCSLLYFVSDRPGGCGAFDIWVMDTYYTLIEPDTPTSSSAPEQPAASLVGKPAPPFTLKDLSGKEISLSDYKGKIVLLDFWATWCGPCRRTIPYMEALHQKYKDQGLVVIGMNDEKDHDKVRAFAKDQMSYIVLLDADKQFTEFAISSIPAAFYIDRHGVIRHSDVGFRPGQEKEMEQQVKDLLTEKAAATSETSASR